MILSVSPHGNLSIDISAQEDGVAGGLAVPKRVAEAFAPGTAQGLLHLATTELETELPPSFAFARNWGRAYLTQLCHRPAAENGAQPLSIPPPLLEERTAAAMAVPPMRGAEYVNAGVLETWWLELDALVREKIKASGQSVQEFLQAGNGLWRMVGRVTFHLAENKRDPEFPFAFLATYSGELSAKGRVQHLPLERALREYGAARNRDALLTLLRPVHQASERIAWVKELTGSGDIYQPLLWTPQEAYQFLRDIPQLEQSGLIVRVPDWWKPARPPRPAVSVKVGGHGSIKLGAGALLDFSVSVTLDGEPLDERELEEMLRSSGGLVSLKGRWVELDREKLAEALRHWKKVERDAQDGGISFFEGMRLISGVDLGGDGPAAASEAAREWTGVHAGVKLEEILCGLKESQTRHGSAPPSLQAKLRPYQEAGVHWLRFLMRLGLGACLADDMGLGKTVQVIALLLHLHQERGPEDLPSLLVVPASLIANWKAELSRFAPSLSIYVAHPSESGSDAAEISGQDLVITTYNMLSRLDWLRQREWNLAILDEAQAIKNSGVRQTRAVKELRACGRIALTGTPIENRLSDLWSLFDFLNPGLLGGATQFTRFAKKMADGKQGSYGPLRALVRPYILRRLKTDRSVIADLPDKTEVKAFCGLSKHQVALYRQSVEELAAVIDQADGIQRRGIVLKYLMRLKQICNHPSQLTSDGEYAPEHSGKFQRLAEICRELAERQQKVLVFSQFREITAPLAEFLSHIFGHPGLVLHGQTPVSKRQKMVEAFQREDGPPFFVLSLKAGGIGLNLTAASHVIHFDRWWNPAVENQATDRAFRIGQKRNVLVHKFVCRGTVEEKIDELILKKTGLSRELLEESGESLLTEMGTQELLRLVSLDINKAMES